MGQGEIGRLTCRELCICRLLGLVVKLSSLAVGGPIFTLVLQKVERKVVCVLNGSLVAENAGYCKFVNGEHS